MNETSAEIPPAEPGPGAPPPAVDAPPVRKVGRPRMYPVDPSKLKRCPRCNQSKPKSAFPRNRSMGDRRDVYCRKCRSLFDYERRGKLPKYMDIQFQHDDVKKIALAFVENPKMTMVEISKLVGINYRNVRAICTGNPYLRAMRSIASQRMGAFIPKALVAMDESLESPDARVKLSAATKILEDQEVMGPQKLNVAVTDLRERPENELRNLIKEALVIPAQTISDDEVI